VRLLREDGHDVRVVPTEAALRFVGAPTWEALSGHPVTHEVWRNVDTVGHVERGRWAELVIVAPATADLLARAAAGFADDLLTTSLLTATCPVLFAPAMHTEMWHHPATQANVATLMDRGFDVMPPAVGRLTGADSGPGRLPEPGDIMARALSLLAPRDLLGRHIVVSAGGTREPLDPVRFLGNRSSGKQGVAIAERALARGASVTLVAAHLEIATPTSAKVIEVDTAESMRSAMHDVAGSADAVIMAAAVADFRPREASATKIKKDPQAAEEARVLELVRNPDILSEIVRDRRPGQIVVGFAAETGDGVSTALEQGRAKLATKGVDILVVNDVSDDRVFGRDSNEAVICQASGEELQVPQGSKAALADTLLDVVAARW
jgi:phosphopantothenoylcysteine decarboxylase/phosphopantothenate--cysteine ligase